MTAALPELAKTIARNLETGQVECVICTETVGRGQPLWSCRRCFGVLHLPCIVFWAENKNDPATGSAAASTGTLSTEFRCPLCQTATSKETLTHRCFCGQLVDPPNDPSITPGSCGQTCNRRRPDPQCPHRCTAQCHPGPCPPCGHTREQGCFCGSDEKTVGCSSNEGEYSCEQECGKELNCGRHYCEARCHPGRCHPCGVEVDLKCWCAKNSKNVVCSRDGGYSCGEACGRTLDCGRHQCLAKCHDGPCAPCLRTPARQRTCACGKQPIEALGVPERTSCDDPIPTCGAPCGMPLPCGHTCEAPCHDGPCAPCVKLIDMACRCGKSKPAKHPCFTSYVRLPLKPHVASSSFGDGEEEDWDEDNPDSYDKRPWLEICEAHGVNKKSLPKLYPPRCQRKCSAKKLCGKHSCTRVCCGEIDHICTIVCRKRAPCGIHECGQLCHRGPCPPCENVSFDPLFCRCRRSVVDPPVPCNTPPPRCNHPCILPRACGHPANHSCHQGECPPCVVPVAKKCGSHGHDHAYYLPCAQPPPSCGKRCGKLLQCCLRTCENVCHAGECRHNCSKKFTETLPDAAGPRR